MDYHDKLKLHEKLYGICAFMDNSDKVDEIDEYLAKQEIREGACI